MVGMNPVNGAADIAIDALIVLQFRKPLNAISLSHGLQAESGSEPIVGATVLSNGNEEVHSCYLAD
jgi:hypothetical protein